MADTVNTEALNLPVEEKLPEKVVNLSLCFSFRSLQMNHICHMGSDYRGQFQLGNGALFGANYIQSLTPNLSLGGVRDNPLFHSPGQVFWAGQHRKSGIGHAARYNTDKMVATGQVASTGMVALSYVQKVSEKVSLATDFMYNYLSRDVTASVGYDYILRQLDHKKKDYKFGFGLTVGQ